MKLFGNAIMMILNCKSILFVVMIEFIWCATNHVKCATFIRNEIDCLSFIIVMSLLSVSVPDCNQVNSAVYFPFQFWVCFRKMYTPYVNIHSVSINWWHPKCDVDLYRVKFTHTHTHTHATIVSICQGQQMHCFAFILYQQLYKN